MSTERPDLRRTRMDIAEFLKARLAEDEATARDALEIGLLARVKLFATVATRRAIRIVRGPSA